MPKDCHKRASDPLGKSGRDRVYNRSLDEDQRAWEVWERKFGKRAESAEEAAKQMRFLQQRGFSSTAISAVMRRAKQRDAE